MNFREEFRLKKLGFGDVASERFCVFQWRLPGLLYMVYRLAVAAYTLAWLIVTRQHAAGGTGRRHPHLDEKDEYPPQIWGAYLTNWSYILLTIYFLAHALVATTVYMCCRGVGLRLTHRLSPTDHKLMFHELRYSGDGYQDLSIESPDEEVVIEQRTWVPWYLAIIWILFNAVSVAALTVSIVFWAILVPGSGMDILNNDNLQLHLVNSILVLIELSLTAIPSRLLHVIYPLLYGLIYVLFSLFYWVADHNHVMYFILDWNKPGQTIGYIILVGVLIVPLIHLFIYGIYRLKMVAFRYVYWN